MIMASKPMPPRQSPQYIYSKCIDKSYEVNAHDGLLIISAATVTAAQGASTSSNNNNAQEEDQQQQVHSAHVQCDYLMSIGQGNTCLRKFSNIVTDKSDAKRAWYVYKNTHCCHLCK